MTAWFRHLAKRWNDYLVSGRDAAIDSYKRLKFALGVLGLLLPLVAVFGGWLSPWHEVQVSISHTYHTNLRDVLVGLLACVAVVFITHRGYGRFDNLVTTLIGLAAAGVALFPCPINSASPANTSAARFIAESLHVNPAAAVEAAARLPIGVFLVDPRHPAAGIVHLVCAGLFFLMVSLFVFFVFTATDQSAPDRAKKNKNRVYRICGAVIFVTLVSLLVIALAAQDFLARTPVGLIGETIMLVAFSVAWLVKAGLPWRWRRQSGAKRAAGAGRGKKATA